MTYQLGFKKIESASVINKTMEEITTNFIRIPKGFQIKN